jgi:hypothetical protein
MHTLTLPWPEFASLANNSAVLAAMHNAARARKSAHVVEMTTFAHQHLSGVPVTYIYRATRCDYEMQS